MKKMFLPKLLVFSGLFALLFEGCRKQDILMPPTPDVNSTIPKSSPAEEDGAVRYDSHLVQSWYSLVLRLIKETPGHTPPIAARSFGYAGVALYESVLGQTPQHHSLAGQLNGLGSLPLRTFGNSYVAPLTANAALARILRKLFPNASAANLEKIDVLEAGNEKMYSPGNSEVLVSRSKNYGYSIADAVFNWSLSDGGYEAYVHNFPTDYHSPSGVGKWTPTPPLFQSAMLPYWGKNRTMLVSDGAGAVDPPVPPLFSAASNSPFYQAAYEVYQTGKNLDEEQKNIGLYWSDGAGTFTPPGHNIAIALQLIRNFHLNLYQAILMLAKIGIALNDVGIVCWRAKYQYNLLRPVSYINLYIDASWKPLIATPPFPSYTSGHSSFSAATATLLTNAFGGSVAFVDNTKESDGFGVRSFTNIKAYAQEAALSRLYGGIHYSFDNENGFDCGERVAMNVEQLRW